MTIMMPTALHEHIVSRESQTLEFKASFDKASIEFLVAFANAQDGTMLVGVSDAGMVGHSSLLTPALNNDRLYKISKIKMNILIIESVASLHDDS